jgi:hypothetical protein
VTEDVIRIVFNYVAQEFEAWLAEVNPELNAINMVRTSNVISASFRGK